MPQEIELRFTVPPGELPRVMRICAPAGFSAGKPRTRRLRALYYDTPEFAFAKAGFTLRVRQVGRAHIQTVKNESTGTLASERAEYESRLSSPRPDIAGIPDAAVRERLEALGAHAELEAVIETDILRTISDLTNAAGDRIELAADRGEIRTLPHGHHVADVSELELELKQGSVRALYDAAREISRAAPLTLGLESKSSRGYRALEGRAIATHKAGRAALPRDGTAEEAFRATLLHCLRHIGRNTQAVAEARDPEGVHQIRVGLRRLRAALSAFGPAFRVPALEDLRGRAKLLADVFGNTRDLDVFERELLGPVEAVSNHAGMPELRLRLDAMRRLSWDRSAALACSHDFTGFLIDLAAAIEARVWREGASPELLEEFLRPARAIAAAALDRALKRACKRARRLASLNVSQRHRLRIALKKLRYAAEFFASLFDAKPVAAYLRRLSKLQDLFGALNDAATAETILGRALSFPSEIAAPESPSAHMAEAAAFVDGWHQSRIASTWNSAKKRWKRFAGGEPFWRS
jgi:inorganic triphosphatase YgiF